METTSVYANYIGPSVTTDANCEGFPICDDRITENDRCVIKIIGIHCNIRKRNHKTESGLIEIRFSGSNVSPIPMRFLSHLVNIRVIEVNFIIIKCFSNA